MPTKQLVHLNKTALKRYTEKGGAHFTEFCVEGMVILHRDEGDEVILGCPPNTFADKQAERDFRMFTIAVIVLLGNVSAYTLVQKHVVINPSNTENSKYGGLSRDMLLTALRRDFPDARDCPYLIPLVHAITLSAEGSYKVAMVSDSKSIDNLQPVDVQSGAIDKGLDTNLGGCYDVPIETALSVTTLLSRRQAWLNGTVDEALSTLSKSVMEYCEVEAEKVSPMFKAMFKGFSEGAVNEGLLLTLPCLNFASASCSGRAH
jgi:hypothetical protein